MDEPIDFKVNKIEPKNIRLADGTIIKSNLLVSSSFILLPNLNDNYDGILGMPFLTLANPDVCWKKKILRWRRNSLTDNQSVLHVSTMHEMSSLSTGPAKSTED